MTLDPEDELSMLAAEVRRAVFTALDGTAPNDLADATAVRAHLYDVAVQQGQPMTDDLDGYINLLLEEFFAGDDVYHKR